MPIKSINQFAFAGNRISTMQIRVTENKPNRSSSRQSPYPSWNGIICRQMISICHIRTCCIDSFKAYLSIWPSLSLECIWRKKKSSKDWISLKYKQLFCFLGGTKTKIQAADTLINGENEATAFSATPHKEINHNRRVRVLHNCQLIRDRYSWIWSMQTPFSDGRYLLV